jgi:hypothetical protein
MNEVSTVSNLITRLIALAIALGAAGTLVDQTFFVQGGAKKAVLQRGISYSKWNATLQSNQKNKK